MQDVLDIARDVLNIEIKGLSELYNKLSPTDNAPLAKSFRAAIDLIQHSSGRIIVTGMGKSGHIGKKIAATLASTGEPASFVHPGEASHGDLGMIAQTDIVLALSNSGETPELQDVIAYCGRFDIPMIAITSGMDSELAKASDILLLLPKVEEACEETRAPTTSTTMTLALGDALAVALLRIKGFTASDFRNFHPGGKLGAALRKAKDMLHEDRQLPLCKSDALVPEAVNIMTKGGFGCVGVVNETEELIGIITDGDLRRHFNDDMIDRSASDLMTKNPQTIEPDTLAAEVLSILSNKHITSLFVLENGKPIGLVHVHDCLATGVI